MKKETAGEVIGHPLWLLPVLLIGMLALIEGLHTSAHLHQNMDVHGICRQNKEYIESKDNEY
tara:strand:- start:123 stop:308 length:186 start_codon:yes stop_codon:yes gene_type:complete